MSSNIDVTETLDVKGQNCPMPVIKTKQAMDDLAAGEVLEVVATDSGSMSDIEGWADSTAGV
ncbi:sulfurtransferase TusA family protein, partial [Salinigranum sp.]